MEKASACGLGIAVVGIVVEDALVMVVVAVAIAAAAEAAATVAAVEVVAAVAGVAATTGTEIVVVMVGVETVTATVSVEGGRARKADIEKGGELRTAATKKAQTLGKFNTARTRTGSGL